MKNSDFMGTLGTVFTKVGFGLKKRSPEILVASGIIGVIMSTVLACRATLKVNDVLEDVKSDVDNIHQQVAYGEPEENTRKALTLTYAKAGFNLIKLYGPSVGLGAMSIACILTSHNILNKRNAALAVAYATIDGGFKEYRKRLAERFGEEVDKELYYNIHSEKVEETIVDENGKTKKVKKTVQIADLNTTSGYARFFDRDTSDAWDKDHDLNLMFVRAQQTFANNLLVTYGYLFLNDVYENLGIHRSIPGQVVGWVYDKTQPVGDNRVDFGIKEVYRKDENGNIAPTILLDFNVDGDIWNRTTEKGLVTT